MRKIITFSTVVLAIATLLFLTSSSPVQAKTLKWAFQGDFQTLDPHSLNETFQLGFIGNIYEGLIRNGADLKILPALAEKWEVAEPTRWRFYLRKNVKFHNGNDFTADDVVFTYKRTVTEGSDMKTRVSGIKEVVKVDDHTVDFITEAPNPILISEWGAWYITLITDWRDKRSPQSATHRRPCR